MKNPRLEEKLDKTDTRDFSLNTFLIFSYKYNLCILYLVNYTFLSQWVKYKSNLSLVRQIVGQITGRIKAKTLKKKSQGNKRDQTA